MKPYLAESDGKLTVHRQDHNQIFSSTRSARHMAAMGSESAGAGDKGWPLFPEENPDDTAVLLKQFLSAEEHHAKAR